MWKMLRERDGRRGVGYGGNFEGRRCYYGMFSELGFPVTGVCGNGRMGCLRVVMQ